MQTKSKARQEAKKDYIDHHEWEKIAPGLNSYGKASQKRLRQRHINYIISVATMNRLVSHLKELFEKFKAHTKSDYELYLATGDEKPGIQHLHFTGPSLMEYSVKAGNPP